MRAHYTMPTHRVTRRLSLSVLVFSIAILGTIPAFAQSTGTFFVKVTDPSTGESVPNLGVNSFQVQEDGATMEILSVESGTTPMKVAILIDNSEVIQQSQGISALRNGLTGFLNTLPPEHEVAMYSIAGNLQELSGFTTDRDALRSEADGLFPGSGGAKMINGLRETWTEAFDGSENWPVFVLVLTDGPETSGNMNPQQFQTFVEDLVVKGAMVHGMVFETRGGGVQSQITPILAQNTGGMYNSFNSANGFVNTLSEFGTKMGEHFDSLSDRYRLIYQRPGDTPGTQIGAGVLGQYQMELFAVDSRRMAEQ